MSRQFITTNPPRWSQMETKPVSFVGNTSTQIGGLSIPKGSMGLVYYLHMNGCFFCGKCRQVYHAWILWDGYVSFRGGNWFIFVEEIHPQLPGICGHGFLVQAVTAKRWLIDCKLDVCMGRTREGTWVSCLICHNFRKVGVYKSNMCHFFPRWGLSSDWTSQRKLQFQKKHPIYMY